MMTMLKKRKRKESEVDEVSCDCLCLIAEGKIGVLEYGRGRREDWLLVVVLGNGAVQCEKWSTRVRTY